MAIALRAAQGSNNLTGGGTITMTTPTGVADDDLMLMAISVRGGTGCTFTPPGFWTTITNPWDPTTVAAAGYGDGTLVVIELNGEVGTSTDFLTVTPSGVSPITTGVRGVAYGNGLWVAVGVAGAMKTATSPTGTWTSRTSQFGAANIAAVHYDNGIWVAVGDAGKISTSTNGTTWTAETPVTAENYLSISYGNGVWVAAGASNIMATATDPTGTWTVNANAPGSGTIGGTAYSPILNRWVATPDGQPYYTTDPTGTWTISANDVFSGSMYYVAYGNGVFVASDSAGDVGSSRDGITWFKEVTAGPSGAQDVVYGAGKFFLATSLAGTFAVGTSWGLLNRSDSTTVLAQELYTKVAFQEPASYAVTITSEKASGVIIAFSGADLSEMEATQYGGQANASNANVTAPALSGFTASDGIDVMFAGTATGTTIAPQASPAYTEPANGESASTGASAGTRTTTEVEYRAMSNVTSAASVVAVASAAAVNIGHHVFVKDPTPPVVAGDFPPGHRSRRSMSQLIAA